MRSCAAGQEIPPTAGLPLRWRDLFPARRDLALALSSLLSIPVPALTCSGTAALIVALRVLQRRSPGRTRLIVPAYTCPLVALAASYCPGLRVLPCDLLPDSIDMDPHHLASLCDKSTLAVVVTHLAGRVADVDRAKAVADAMGAAIIEDAAQAMGALDGRQSVGLKGEIGFFSLAVGKGLTTFEGGVLFSRDPKLHAELLQQCRDILPALAGWELRRCVELWGYALFYRPRALHFVYGNPLRRALRRHDEISAVGDDFSRHDIPLHRLGAYRRWVGAAALPRLPGYLEQNRARVQIRLARLRALPGLLIIDDAPGGHGTWPFILLLMPTRGQRDRIMDRLWQAGAGVTRLFIHVLPDYPNVLPLLEDTGFLTVARRFADCSLSISNSHWLDDVLFDGIVRELSAVLAANPH